MAKISGLINAKEREIAARVRQVRYSNQLTIPEFATALGISDDRLVSIEYGRTPLKVGDADNISSKFDVNLSWLATGGGRMKPCIGLIRSKYSEIKASELFSKAYSPELKDDLIKKESFLQFMMAAILMGRAGLPKGSDAFKYVECFHEDFDDLFKSLPQEGKEKLLGLFVRTLASFSTDWEIGNYKTPGENITMLPEKRLTHVSDSVNVPAVKPKLPSLLDRLKRASAQRGKKSDLAKFLGVSLVQVSQWLSGDREPGGETTLRLLQWVEQQERQK